MKLLELEIMDVRGIRHLILKPDGRNVVVWGPNGAGKSAVVDALDFLLTGRMSRLGGPGTAGITLAKHGPHIDSTAKAATVRGVFSVSGIDDFEMTRCVASPNTLDLPDEVWSHVEPVLGVAAKGQHVLTRREILRFVTAEAGSRAEQIQHLLNLDDLEALRRTLVTTQRESERRTQAARRRLDESLLRIKVVMGVPQADQESVATFVNESRAVLGGAPLSPMVAANLKENLEPPGSVTSASDPGSNGRIAVAAVLALLTPDRLNAASAAALTLRERLAQIETDGSLGRELSRRGLTQLGLQLLEGDACPLCDFVWPTGDLEGRLNARLASAEEASRMHGDIQEAIGALRSNAVSLAMALNALIALVKEDSDREAFERLTSWLRTLQEEDEVLEEASRDFSGIKPERVNATLAPEGIKGLLDGLVDKWKAKAEVAGLSPQQAAWDSLTRLEEHLDRVEAERSELAYCEQIQRRATQLTTAFQEARESVLHTLYEDIKDRFVALYRELHYGHEPKFDAVMQPSQTGLDFQGRFPRPRSTSSSRAS